MPGLPDVSLITSWHAGTPGSSNELTGMDHALEAGIRVLDLYFLNHDDLPWYLEQVADIPRAVPRDDQERECPLRFAASLNPLEIEKLGEALLDRLIEKYRGRLIGSRPRFAALATYWPQLAADDGEARRLSILAVRNSLILADKLGCQHVEIVGGYAYSGEDGGGHSGRSDREAIAKGLREARLKRLAESLEEVLTPPEGIHLPDNLFLCVEAEPGSAYLIHDVESYHNLRERLGEPIKRRVLLNLDLAHMFLADASRKGGETLDQFAYLQKHNLFTTIGHFHMSDHARSHASDLCPGTYHFFDKYEAWLRQAILLMSEPTFSRTLAVEMEACSDIHEVRRGIGRTQAWLRSLAPEADEHDFAEGVLMAVDITKSTKVLAFEGNPDKLKQGAKRIDLAVSAICRRIQRHRGSVYSFTGDGVVALFDSRHFHSREECVSEATKAADSLRNAMKESIQKSDEWRRIEENNLWLRVSLFWGSAVIPEVGSLRCQILGCGVIIACRMLNACDKEKGGIVAAENVREISSEKQRWIEMDEAILEDPEKFGGLNWVSIRDLVGKLFSYPRR